MSIVPLTNSKPLQDVYKRQYEYHVNRPVNYILEADAEKRMFLEKTRFFESGFLERISGAGDDQRMAQLRSITQKAVDLIVREYERKAGKILLVVNSYAQALEVQQTLETALRKANCSARTCRMISDAINAPSGEDTVRRGAVSYTHLNDKSRVPRPLLRGPAPS